jgi:protein-S-isoprenylcysteine O-methyltransferase Ste14
MVGRIAAGSFVDPTAFGQRLPIDRRQRKAIAGPARDGEKVARARGATMGGSTTAGSRTLIVAVAIIQLAISIALSALGWGGLGALLAHPARAAFVALMILATAAALLSPVNLSSGQRESVRGRLIFIPAAAGVTLLAWLMPYMDRHDAWTIDGDAVRYLGVAAMFIGSILRVWPMFVLGHRFSGLVAIQRDHQLVTTGPYRFVRNPSYAGMMIGMAGWALIFRSSVGVVLTALGFVLLVSRIRDEEALLSSQFGAEYAEYCRRTWRLVPGIY